MDIVQIVDAIYERASNELDEILPSNTVHLIVTVMQIAEEYGKQNNNMDKLGIVTTVVNKLVEKSNLNEDVKKTLIQSVEILLPGIISSVCDATKGRFKINSGGVISTVLRCFSNCIQLRR